MRARSMRDLDLLDPEIENQNDQRSIGRTRKHYFLRRSICSLNEFAQCLRLLSGCTELQVVKRQWSAPRKREWEDAVSFFRSKESILKKVRNDIGGHFGREAALYAVEHLEPTSVGKIEIDFNPMHSANMKFHFVAEIAATAFTRHLPGDDTEEKVQWLFNEVLVPGYGHATESVQVLAALELWPRFGK